MEDEETRVQCYIKLQGIIRELTDELRHLNARSAAERPEFKQIKAAILSNEGVVKPVDGLIKKQVQVYEDEGGASDVEVDHHRGDRSVPRGSGVSSVVCDPFAPAMSLSQVLNPTDQCSEGPFLAASRGIGYGAQREGNTKEDADGLHLRMNLSGLGKELMKVSGEENTLTIKGEGEKEWEYDVKVRVKWKIKCYLPAARYFHPKYKFSRSSTYHKNGKSAELCLKLKLDKHVYEIKKAEEKSAELAIYLGSATEKRAKDGLLSTFTKCMLWPDMKRNNTSGFSTKSELIYGIANDVKYRNEMMMKKDKSYLITNLAATALDDEVKFKVISIDKRYPKLFVSPELSKVVAHWPKENVKFLPHSFVSFEHDMVVVDGSPEIKSSFSEIHVEDHQLERHQETVWNAKAILTSGLSRSALETLSSDKNFDDHVTHICNILKLAVLKRDHALMAIGGPCGSVDGCELSVDESVLIQAAPGYTKDLAQLDLHKCQQWKHFLEIHYDRNGKGRLFSHKDITTLFVPDLSDCSPSFEKWKEQWLALKKAVSQRDDGESTKTEEKSRMCEKLLIFKREIGATSKFQRVTELLEGIHLAVDVEAISLGIKDGIGCPATSTS